jgi:predicted ATP-grasp superfamily ATP-dependent carboligase
MYQPPRDRGPESPPRYDCVVLGDLNLVRAVGLAGLHPLVVSRNPHTARSRYAAGSAEITPAVESLEQSAEDLVALGERFSNRPVLYFSNDAHLLLVSRYRVPLLERFRFLLPDAKLIEDVVDKERFHTLATRYRLPVPGTLLVEMGGRDVPEPPWGYPCIVKPTSRVGWYESGIMGSVPHKALRARDRSDLSALTERLRNGGRAFLLQEYVGGGDDEIYSYHAYRDETGRTLAWFVGRKVRTYPVHTGRSTCLELADRANVAAMGEEILDRIGLTGVVKLDFKRDPIKDRLYLLEINPRFNLWHYLGALSGVNLPGVAYRHLMGVWSGSSPHYRLGIRWMSVPMDLRASMSLVRAGQLNLGAWLRSYAGPTVYNRFAWSDPMPVLSSGASTVLRGLRRFLPSWLRPRASSQTLDP